ncbi:hypothetical protein ASG52_04905 [Methylobacterium sp. Leaf456]|nr:hypothetical protein ASG52_04905 [Methylobacterium sp. Leaf456]
MLGMCTISAILPISDHEKVRRNIDRAKLLIDSLEKFWSGEALPLFIVTPDHELASIQDQLLGRANLKNVRLSFLKESELDAAIANAPDGYGIAKQMLIKLSAFRISTSDYYLILDSDICCCKSISKDALIKNGKALTEFFAYPKNYPWYVNSAKVLQADIATVNFGEPRLFVTPEILAKEILVALSEKINSMYPGQSWVEFLLSVFDKRDNHYWTEYSLYDIFSSAENLFLDHHFAPEPGAQPLHCMDQSIWVQGSIPNWDPAKAFSGESRGYFLVLQSIMAYEIDFDVIDARVRAAWQHA